MGYTKGTKIVLVILLLAIIAMSSFTYSYFQNVKTTKSVEEFDTNCFDIEYVSLTDGINLEKTYPIPDEEGLKLAPYTFKVTNICPYDMLVNVKLNMIKNTTLDAKYVKIALDKSLIIEPTLLSEFASVSYDEYKYIDSKLLKTVSLIPDETIEVDLRMWLDGDTPNSEGLNAYLSSKVEVEAYNK
ncbi:MAG: hypothetical protein IJ574_00745 [Bacilli bacterium]|nr:hypothetical protein [Bacilli bacterium]